MSYWVYEDRQSKFARIHRATCKWCKDGRGIHPNANREIFIWYGPIGTREGAERIAARFGYQPASCPHCEPERS